MGLEMTTRLYNTSSVSTSTTPHEYRNARQKAILDGVHTPIGNQNDGFSDVRNRDTRAEEEWCCTSGRQSDTAMATFRLVPASQPL